MTPIEELIASDARRMAEQARHAARHALDRLRERGVRAKLVGSLARGDFLPHSDVDILVLSCPSGLRYALEDTVEDALEGRPFDAIYLDEVRPERRARLLAEAVGLEPDAPPRSREDLMTGTAIALDEPAWETWDDPALAARSAVRWRLVFSGRRTPIEAMSMGLAEIAPGGVLPLHHHAPAEIYHILEGEGRTEVEGVAHALRPGVSLFIPANARHRTTNPGPGRLRFLFVFPTDTFEEVVYHFDE